MSDSLISWVQDRLAPLFEQTQEESVQASVEGLFHATFTEDAKITFNHEQIPLAKFKSDLSQGAFSVTKAVLQWKDVIDLPHQIDTTPLAHTTGIVAGEFTVNQTLKIRIRAGPAERVMTSIFSVKVVVPDHPAAAAVLPPHGLPDPRRISELIITSVTKPVPIHL